jgi:PAS domain S-box-containing protein
VIKDLTKYINAIQGGFYLLDDADPSNKVFNLTAFFAYDRRKFADQQIKWGDGLVGTCALEQKIIHLSHVPESYITVTSGLGETKPDSLLIVPMQYEGQIYGVFEFASFGKFEPNHVTLVEKTAESVAATLSAVRTNQNTRRLLEESKAQTQALTSHEEEMRQNMEELQATQEEATRQSQRFLVLEETINQHLMRGEFDMDGRLVNANKLFFSKFEYGSDANIEGRHILDFITGEERDGFKEIWNKLVRSNESYKGYIKHVTRTGKDLWTIASLSLTHDDDPALNRIMLLAIDISEEQNRIQKNELIAESVSNCGIRFELDIIGNLLNCNEIFKQVFKLTQKDIKSLVVFDIINPIELDDFNKRWDGIIKGNGFTGVLRCKNVGGNNIWLSGKLTPNYNVMHEVETVIFIGSDITHEKQLETEVKSQAEILKKQERLIRDAEKDLTSKIRETRNELLDQLKITERIKNMNEKILEDSPDAIITTGHNNRIVFFNKAAEQLWNINRNEVLQQDISILFPEKLTDKDELIGSFTRPGDHKITGHRRNSTIINKNGTEKQVKILLTKARVDNENAYTAFIQVED